MAFIFSKHAEEQLLRRGINRTIVEVVVLQPDQILADEEDVDMAVYQSLIKDDGQMFFLRVFVNTSKSPNVVVTVYKTTKIHKYYESKI
ncbi:DUF4258 domain-containing protein [Viscerimonas tarda]